VIVIVLPEGCQERSQFRDCTPYKIYKCIEHDNSADRYVFTDDRNDQVGLNGRGDGVSYLLL